MACIILVGCAIAASIIGVRIDQTWKATPRTDLEARDHRTSDRSTNHAIFSEHAAGIQSLQSEPEVKKYRRVIVQDAGTLLADKTRISLAGLNALELNTACRKSDNDVWPCGKRARRSLRRFIRSRSVQCTVVERLTAKSFTAQCTVGARNINQWVVRQGWAKPSDLASSTYEQSLENAKREQNGIWKYAQSMPTDG